MPSATSSQTIGPFWHLIEHPEWADLTRFGAAGSKVILAGSVTDGDGNPVTDAAVELWQADPPADERFPGFGRCRTDQRGEFRFTTIKPGAYPWRNHFNAWRPNHIHFSLFGNSIAARLVTQMYFPGDPLLALDPIFLSIPDEAARNRLICALDMSATEPEWALGYRFDIVLRGREATPMGS